MMKDFVATEVPLENSNLIEASAGTGKTYSIAVLVLRLLLEKQIPLKEILMVTFTKAAVAELEERVRLFIRLAGKSAEGHQISDETISAVVRNAAALYGPEKIRKLLEQAILLLDDTSVLTIHGFCQQTLNEFAFETGQLFGNETIPDEKALISDEVDAFWRKHVTSIPKNLLPDLIGRGLSREILKKLLLEQFGGKKFVDYIPGIRKSYTGSEMDEDVQAIEKARADLAAQTQTLYDRLRNEATHWRSITLSNTSAKKAYLDLLDDPEKFFKKLIPASKKANPAGYLELYRSLVEDYETVVEAELIVTQRCFNPIRKLFCLCIEEALENVAGFKSRNSVLSFDDMINHLHKAVMADTNENLLRSLRDKYKAAFIDEFQDTDRAQYEIFDKLFARTNILFYIGDPKQSIYGWRKADINTYLRAAKAVTNQYGMNINYRSCPAYIEAMNVFFEPIPGFDTFAFRGQPNSFSYIPVGAPTNKKNPGLLYGNDTQAPVLFYECPNQPSISESVALKVLGLLEDKNYQLEIGGSRRKIIPADIGILVRGNDQAWEIKEALSGLNIPSVTINDSKILESPDTDALLFVLEAMENTDRHSINKALLSGLTGFDRKKILQLDEEEQQARFKDYRTIWNEKGIYRALSGFLKDYRVRSHILNHSGGDRSLTNLVQLTEMLHKAQMNGKLSNGELITWFKKAIENKTNDGDEYLQRIESDEASVRILTVHKSKGLEYNIVFAPYLDMEAGIRDGFCSLRDPDNGDYIFMDKSQLTPDQDAAMTLQLEQENRRLLYVTITRAVYQCLIFENVGGKKDDSTLKEFSTAIRTHQSGNPLIGFAAHDSIPAFPKYSGKAAWTPATALPTPEKVLDDKYWHKLSYTFLAAKPPYSVKENLRNISSGYDQFIFRQLPRSALTGNLLHYILENIDFTRTDTWPRVIQSGIRRFFPTAEQLLSEKLPEMLEQIVYAQIRIGDAAFSLSDIQRAKRISELEFDFNIGRFVNTELGNLSDETGLLLLKEEQPLEGMMNGIVDLIFEHGGKYYIIDWKSNFLGDSLKWYQPEQLATAMNENNYHLQYLIYTLALKKYLSVKKPDFDYERDFGGVAYLFLRGLRKNDSTGVYSGKPAAAQIRRLGEILTGAGHREGVE